MSDSQRTNRVRETAHVDDSEDLQYWFDEVRRKFEKKAGYDRAVSIDIVWNKDDDREGSP